MERSSVYWQRLRTVDALARSSAPLLRTRDRTPPGNEIAGLFRDQQSRGAITVWYGHPDRFEVRWQHGKQRARYSVEILGRALEEIDPGPPDRETALDRAGTKAERWARAAERIRREPELLAANSWLAEVERRQVASGASEIVFVERQVVRRIGRRVEWKFQTMPLAALALFAEHRDAVAVALRRAVADVPRRLAQRRGVIADRSDDA